MPSSIWIYKTKYRPSSVDIKNLSITNEQDYKLTFLGLPAISKNCNLTIDQLICCPILILATMQTHHPLHSLRVAAHDTVLVDPLHFCWGYICWTHPPWVAAFRVVRPCAKQVSFFTSEVVQNAEASAAFAEGSSSEGSGFEFWNSTCLGCSWFSSSSPPN